MLPYQSYRSKIALILETRDIIFHIELPPVCLAGFYTPLGDSPVVCCHRAHESGLCWALQYSTLLFYPLRPSSESRLVKTKGKTNFPLVTNILDYELQPHIDPALVQDGSIPHSTHFLFFLKTHSITQGMQALVWRKREPLIS